MPQTLTYPLTIANGSFALSENEDLQYEAILSVLETRPTERIERPDYGTPDFVFEAISTPLSIAGRIDAAITDQVDGIEDLLVESEEFDSGLIDVTIKYAIAKTQREIYLRLS